MIPEQREPQGYPPALIDGSKGMSLEERARRAAAAVDTLTSTCPAEASEALKILAEDAADAVRLRRILALARLQLLNNLDLNSTAVRKVLLALDDEIESLHQLGGS